MSRILIKNGTIISMDRQTGDLRGDVLVNDRIAAIGPAIEVADAEVVDASEMIVIPSLINSHIHTWETGLRGIAGDWTMPQYGQVMHRGLANYFRPLDIYIANLMGALTSINPSITTMVDWCHNNRTPEHPDAAIDGLQKSGCAPCSCMVRLSPDPNRCPHAGKTDIKVNATYFHFLTRSSHQTMHPPPMVQNAAETKFAL